MKVGEVYNGVGLLFLCFIFNILKLILVLQILSL